MVDDMMTGPLAGGADAGGGMQPGYGAMMGGYDLQAFINAITAMMEKQQAIRAQRRKKGWAGRPGLSDVQKTWITAKTPEQKKQARREATSTMVNWTRLARNSGYDPRDKWVQDVPRGNKTSEQYEQDLAAAAAKQRATKAQTKRKLQAATAQARVRKAVSGKPGTIRSVTATTESQPGAYERNLRSIQERYGISREQARELLESGGEPVSGRRKSYTGQYQVEGRPLERTSPAPTQQLASEFSKSGLEAQRESLSPDEEQARRRRLEVAIGSLSDVLEGLY